MLSELAGQFDRMPPAEASALLSEHYGVTAVELERLDTERDDSFRVTTADGYLVLKVAHPADDPLVIDLQTTAMRRAADHGLPTQRLVPTLLGAETAVVDGRIARVFDWLNGDLLAETTPDQAQLFAMGAELGRLSRALAELEHPASHRVLAWDLQRTAGLRQYTTDPIMTEVIDRFERVVAPALRRLPQQVIHNDFHPGNLLVNSVSARFVVGILDFGDVVHTARICDLGVTLAYLIPEQGDVWGAAEHVIGGFESILPLLPAERDLLPDLLAARLVMRSVIPNIVPRERTDSLHYADKNLRLLHRLLEGT